MSSIHAQETRDPPWPSGYDAWLPSVSSQVRVSAGSPSNINVRRCGRLSMVLEQMKDPLELFVKRREFRPGSGFLSRRDMTKAVESDVKTNTFLPSFATVEMEDITTIYLLERLNL